LLSKSGRINSETFVKSSGEDVWRLFGPGGATERRSPDAGY